MTSFSVGSGITPLYQLKETNSSYAEQYIGTYLFDDTALSQFAETFIPNGFSGTNVTRLASGTHLSLAMDVDDATQWTTPAVNPASGQQPPYRSLNFAYFDGTTMIFDGIQYTGTATSTITISNIPAPTSNYTYLLFGVGDANGDALGITMAYGSGGSNTSASVSFANAPTDNYMRCFLQMPQTSFETIILTFAQSNSKTITFFGCLSSTTQLTASTFPNLPNYIPSNLYDNLETVTNYATLSISYDIDSTAVANFSEVFMIDTVDNTGVTSLDFGPNTAMTIAVDDYTKWSTYTSSFDTSAVHYVDNNASTPFGMQFIGTPANNSVVTISNISNSSTAYHYLVFSKPNTQYKHVSLVCKSSGVINIALSRFATLQFYKSNTSYNGELRSLVTLPQGVYDSVEITFVGGTDESDSTNAPSSFDVIFYGIFKSNTLYTDTGALTFKNISFPNAAHGLYGNIVPSTYLNYFVPDDAYVNLTTIPTYASSESEIMFLDDASLANYISFFPYSPDGTTYFSSNMAIRYPIGIDAGITIDVSDTTSTSWTTPVSVQLQSNSQNLGIAYILGHGTHSPFTPSPNSSMNIGNITNSTTKFTYLLLGLSNSYNITFTVYFKSAGLLLSPYSGTITINEFSRVYIQCPQIQFDTIILNFVGTTSANLIYFYGIIQSDVQLTHAMLPIYRVIAPYVSIDLTDGTVPGLRVTAGGLTHFTEVMLYNGDYANNYISDYAILPYPNPNNTTLSTTESSGNSWPSFDFSSAATYYYYEPDTTTPITIPADQFGLMFTDDGDEDDFNPLTTGFTNADTNYYYLLLAKVTSDPLVIILTLHDINGTDLGYTNHNIAITGAPRHIAIQLPQDANIAGVSLFLQISQNLVSNLGIAGFVKSNTTITAESLQCFLEDAMILTTDGEKKIIDIVPGDKIIDGHNEIKTIRHLWTRTCYNVANGTHVYPYLVEKNRYGENIPNNDLHISPHHGVYSEGIDGPMTPAMNLGLSQVELKTPFSYYNLDLEEGYGTMIVNGLICETYNPNKINGLVILK